MLKYLRGLVLGALVVMTACQSQPAGGPVAQEKSFEYSPVYKIQGDSVTFILDPKRYGQEEVESVQLRGTFSSWKAGPWNLKPNDQGLWTITVSRDSVDIPGNSGQPEFKFILNDGWLGAENEPDGWHFKDNFVILFPGDDPKDIAQRSDQAQSIRDSYETEAELSNFRELSGGSLAPGKLFRSYHPYIASRGALKSEEPRLQTVQKLMEQKKIHGVINLSDSPQEFKLPDTPKYYLNLFNQGKVLLTTTSYEDSYFHPEGTDYAKVLQETFNFIAKNSGPYQVHCRLGTDRTGVLSAVLEAFMGVPWKTIAQDFQKSNELGIKEYRHWRLLAYSFKRMLGTWPQDIADLKGAITKFLERQGIPSETLAKAFKNLNS